MHIPVSEAKAKLYALANNARSGTAVYLTNHGKTVAEIRPVDTDRPQKS